MIFDRGSRVCWKTVDGVTHTGVVTQVVKDGHMIQEGEDSYSRFVPSSICVEKARKAGKA